MKQPNPNWRVTVQEPEILPDGSSVPGYVQIDDIENGQNNWSKGPAKLLEEGYEVPLFHLLPAGQYNWKQASILVRRTAARQSPHPILVEGLECLIRNASVDHDSTLPSRALREKLLTCKTVAESLLHILKELTTH